jgi:hypothetical protein
MAFIPAIPMSYASLRLSQQKYPLPLTDTSAIGALVLSLSPGLFNQRRSCWLRFAPQQYALSC